MIDFSCVWKNNLIYSVQEMRCELSWLIIYILMICRRLNTINISILSDYNICKQWKNIINKLILFCIQYIIKLIWIWFLCPFIISNCRWSAAFLYIKGLKTLINQYKFKSFEIQLFLDIIKYQLSEIFLLIYYIFIYSFLNIKIKITVLSVALMYLIFIIHFYFPAITLYFCILSGYISTFITCFLLILNPDLSIFHIFKRL